ncbi:MAG TPA: hypothetical protein VFI11_08590 [Anaerolineales bacterium]|nr:hypothetical protein [Anaerolineales bacterium]
MRTPAGQECPHYYADFHRGRQRQECRLVGPAGPRWKPSDCGRCPVPRIVLANACPNLRLAAAIQPGVLGLGRHVVVTAHCPRYETAVAEPEIGCGHCHELFEAGLARPEAG